MPLLAENQFVWFSYLRALIPLLVYNTKYDRDRKVQ